MAKSLVTSKTNVMPTTVVEYVECDSFEDHFFRNTMKIMATCPNQSIREQIE